MKYLGVDWGMKKLGLSISEGDLASPLAVLTVQGLDDAILKVGEIAKQQQPDLLVIGKPETGQIKKAVEKAVVRFEKLGYQLKVVDETLSTNSAKAIMIDLGYSQQDRRDDHAVAAAILLQRFLDDLKVAS